MEKNKDGHDQYDYIQVSTMFCNENNNLQDSKICFAKPYHFTTTDSNDKLQDYMVHSVHSLVHVVIAYFGISKLEIFIFLEIREILS